MGLATRRLSSFLRRHPVFRCLCVCVALCRLSATATTINSPIHPPTYLYLYTRTQRCTRTQTHTHTQTSGRKKMATGWRVFLYGCFCHHYHRPQPYCSDVKGKKHVYNICIYVRLQCTVYVCLSLVCTRERKPHNRRPHSTAHTDPNHKIMAITHIHTTIRSPPLCKIRLSLHFTRHVKTTPI